MSAPTGPVFVVGRPRSGTTLLTLMLSSHSRIAIPPETRFLLPVYRRRASFGDLGDLRNRRRLARALVRRKGTKFRHLGLDKKAVNRAVKRSPPTIGSAIGAVYRTYAASQGKVRWGDKRPTYFRNVELLRTLFPDAQFVHLVRDGRDCVASLKRMRWWRHGTTGAVATWVHAVDCGAREARRLPAGTWHELRYEDLVADPRRELESLCAFLGEEFEGGMLAPHVLADRLPRRQREVWHAETRGVVDARRVGSYADVLTEAELALVERVAGSRLRRWGYEVPAGRRRPSLPALARYGKVLTVMRAKTRLQAARDRARARPVAAVADRG
jgi:hypothetical protein